MRSSSTSRKAMGCSQQHECLSRLTKPSATSRSQYALPSDQAPGGVFCPVNGIGRNVEQPGHHNLLRVFEPVGAGVHSAIYGGAGAHKPPFDSGERTWQTTFTDRFARCRVGARSDPSTERARERDENLRPSTEPRPDADRDELVAPENGDLCRRRREGDGVGDDPDGAHRHAHLHRLTADLLRRRLWLTGDELDLG